jgi:hypothetical protein
MSERSPSEVCTFGRAIDEAVLTNSFSRYQKVASQFLSRKTFKTLSEPKRPQICRERERDISLDSELAEELNGSLVAMHAAIAETVETHCKIEP